MKLTVGAVTFARQMARGGLTAPQILPFVRQITQRDVALRTVQHAIRGSTHADVEAPPVPRPEGNPWMRGQRHHNAKLSPVQVLKVWSEKNGPRTAPEVADDYGVTRSCVDSIWSGRNWSWLTSAVDNADAGTGGNGGVH